MTLQTTALESKEFEKFKNFVLNCYEKYECYLLPHPGEKVANDARFSGKVAGTLN